MDEFLIRHLKGVSRTYAIVIPMLPRELAPAVGLAYLLMRVVDTFEDAPGLGDGERAARLNTLDDVLRRLDRGDTHGAASDELTRVPGAAHAEAALLLELSELFQRLAATPANLRRPMITCARGMIGGVLGMLERSAQRGLEYPGVQDSEELRTYCHYVAGVVGEMLCSLMSQHLRSPALLRLRPVAIELGMGLQLVNILKDALTDARAGRRYLPQAPSGEVDRGEIYRAVLCEARASLSRGAEFVLALPATAWELRSFCGLPIAWGALTLRRAERDQCGAKIGRSAIQATITRFTELAANDRALRRWLNRLIMPRRGPAPS